MSDKGKNFLAVLFLLVLLVGFLRTCGPFHEHEWQEATCTEPRICSICHETEGEALGHDWQDATCTAPKTCARCGKTDGEPTAHVWSPATCESPEVCSVCGAENKQSSPLGHDWLPATLTSPAMCSRCGLLSGDPLSESSFNRGNYDRWGAHPLPSQYIGLTGYVAVTHQSFQYGLDESPYENDWFSPPWKATTYEPDKQFWNPTGAVEHKTAVVVIGQSLVDEGNTVSCYSGYLLVERVDNGEQFYISVVDFVTSPYWEADNVIDTLDSGPCLAVYHQISDYYPVDRQNKRADISDGDIVLISGRTSGIGGGVNSATHPVDALSSCGRCFINADDLTIIY